MIICMCDYGKLIAITNRHLCKNDYLAQIEKITALNPKAVILREKDLSLEEYSIFAQKVMEICKAHNTDLFIHSHVNIAMELGCRNIHFSISSLRKNINNLKYFDQISVSCHSLEDVKEATDCGATRVLFGNVFETQCKQGLKGKGLNCLEKICKASSVPVYAIGGINLDNLNQVIEHGATGGCMMSGFMTMD